MREWLVGGGVIEGPGGVLLVQNRRRNGLVDWSTPGGVIDDGESMVEGLTREVLEETGLTVTEWQGPIYEIVAEAPGLGWRLTVQAFRSIAHSGEVVVADPDGIVVDACYTPTPQCAGLLEMAPRWVREPLVEWLAERWDSPRTYTYSIAGTEHRDLVVTRH